MESEPAPPAQIRPALLVVAAAILAVLVFLPSLSGGWIYDDKILIEGNPYIHSFSHWTHWFTTDFWDVNEELVRVLRRLSYWRPAINVTYAIEWKVGGGSPAVFHLMNLVWQGVMGALAFAVLRRWIGAAIPALVAATLFAIHPTKAESVAWIAGRTDVLCMVFVLLACEGMARRRRGARGGLALECAGTILAYLCKEQAIVLPAFAAIEAWVALDRAPLDLATVRAMLRAAIPQLVVVAVYLGLRALLLPIGTIGSAPPLATHVGVILETYGRFVALTAAPHDLSVQQGLVHSSGGSQLIAVPYALLGGVALVGITALAIGLRRRRPEVAVGLGFYVLTLLPTANVKTTQLQTLISERFLYLPCLGLALLGGILLARATPRHRRLGYFAAGAIALVFAGLSLSRSADFQTEEGFWTRELELHPDSGMAREYMVSLAMSRRAYPEALRLLLAPQAEAHDRDRQEEVRRAFAAAQIAAQLVPDHDVVRLRAIDAFCKTLLTHDQPKAVLPLEGGELAIDTTGPTFAASTAQSAPWLLALRVELATRLGDDAAATVLAESAVASCPKCLPVVPSAIYAMAAAGHYERARAMLAVLSTAVDEAATAKIADRITKAERAHTAGVGATGIEALRLRGAELSALELWGRAYDVFAPYLDEVATAPKAASRVAELAFRAGEPAVARRLLFAASPLSDIDGTFARWAASMGW